jgi:Ohr subfamily peroxiredoxin
MSKTLYTAKAHVVGGRDAGHGRSSDGVLEVDLRLPAEMGGSEAGTNPEQLFAVGYAACFEGALGGAARRRRVDLGAVAIDSAVSLSPNDSKGFDLSVELDVTLGGIADTDEAIAIVQDAHQICPYSNATRGNIPVTLTVNGTPVP